MMWGEQFDAKRGDRREVVQFALFPTRVRVEGGSAIVWLERIVLRHQRGEEYWHQEEVVRLVDALSERLAGKNWCQIPTTLPLASGAQAMLPLTPQQYQQLLAQQQYQLAQRQP